MAWRLKTRCLTQEQVHAASQIDGVEEASFDIFYKDGVALTVWHLSEMDIRKINTYLRDPDRDVDTLAYMKETKLLWHDSTPTQTVAYTTSPAYTVNRCPYFLDDAHRNSLARGVVVEEADKEFGRQWYQVRCRTCGTAGRKGYSPGDATEYWNQLQADIDPGSIHVTITEAEKDGKGRSKKKV